MARFEAFAAAISAQESGGSYSARNPSSGALGKYQVMPANIGPWSQEILGYRISPAQFLASPQLQEKIALGKLRKYYEAYGPRGAAAAWYAGNPRLSESDAPQPGGPSVRGYVDAVMARMGGSEAAFAFGWNPFEGLGDAAGGVAGGVADAVWMVGRPVLLTGVLVAAGGVLVVLGAWRATQR